MSIRRKSINDGTTISKKMKRTIDERHSEVPRRGRGEQGLEFDKDSEDQEQKVHSMCECQRRQAHRKSHRESQLHGEKTPYRGKTRGQVRVKTRLRWRTSQGKYKVVNYVDKKNLEWNTEFIEAMELEHVMSQAAQDLNDGEMRHESWKAQAHENEYPPQTRRGVVDETREHQFIKRRLVSSTARPHEPRRCV